MSDSASGKPGSPAEQPIDKPRFRGSAETSSVLLDVMSALVEERDLDALLMKITQKATEVMGADRSTLFLVDQDRGELWSKVAEGETANVIRVPLGVGIVGYVASAGEPLNIRDAYRDKRFNPEVDRKTGYRTRTILAMPVKNREGKILGALQVLNKRAGPFEAEDEELLEAFASQAAVAIQNALLDQQLRHQVQTSEILLNVMRAVASELEIDQLLQKIVAKTSEAMNADRCTLFLIDRRTGDLWSKVAQGPNLAEIRVPRGMGIAGHVALTGETVNIRDAYRDPRFNPEVDRRTGYRTRTILCMPLMKESGEIVGVMQVLNKAEGTFEHEDEGLLGALGSQAVIALENARLFEEVRFMKNYNESILRTMETGVVTLGPDGRIAYANGAGLRIFSGRTEITAGEPLEGFFREDVNPELVQGIVGAVKSSQAFTAYELQYRRGEDVLNIHIHALPLADSKGASLGVVVIADDITQEQRLMSTLCRYVTRQIAEQVMRDRGKLKLGGNRSMVTVLFSDIRSFTTISEQSTAEEIVTMLNEYFGRMIDPIFRFEGTLDKFIGDAIMAVFGAPVSREDDAVRAVQAALAMRKALKDYNRERVAAGMAPIENGIGITCGEAISGNIGSEQRMDYTVIGDTVNVASRLEGLTKNYPCKILINETVYDQVRDKIPCVDLGFVQVKGKGDDVHIFGVPESESEA